MDFVEDKDLVKEFLNGNEIAFRTIVDRYSKKIYWHARGMLNNHFDADEVTQEVIIVLYKKLHTFNFNSALYTWIYRITSTRTLNLIRKKKIKELFSISDEEYENYKDNKEVFNMPKNWNWYHEVNRTLITGQNLLVRHYLTKEPFKTAEYYNTCYVQGHSHEDFKLWWFMDKNKNYWGATIGCLVDDKSLAMAYNKGNLKRPELGCMVIVEGVPKLIPLRLKNNIWTGELE